MKKFGIDTSRWQGDFDFAKAMQEHKIEFAILKAGGGDDGKYKDVQFEKSYKKCEKAGLDKGAYFFGHAMTMEEAKSEASYFLSLLKGKKFEYPVFYDVEGDMLKLDKNTLTDICLYVLQTIQKAGYWVGIYTSDSHFEHKVDDEKLKEFSHWVASYTSKEPVLESGSELQMWQFGGSTNLIRSKEINGQTVDQNYCYVDYPTQIKDKGLNGFSNTVIKEEPVKNTTSNKIEIGDVVDFTGTVQYSNSYPGAKAYSCKPGKAKVTALSEGKAYPYHLVKVNGGGSTVYGWVKASDIKGTATVNKTIEIGDEVNYSGNVHYSSSYAGAVAHKCTGGKAKVTAYSKGKPHPYHLVHTGKGCTVYGWVDADKVSK